MVTSTHQTRSQQIINRHDRFMSMNYPRFPMAMVKGEGSRLYDAAGKVYIDLFPGFGGAILGHCHPDLVKAVMDQAQRLWHTGNLLHTEPQTRAAEAIATHGFSGRCFFAHSGADANEAAFKLARLYGQAHPAATGQKRFRIISMDQSFHGRTFATMVATGQAKVRQGFEPTLPGFVQVPYNDLDAVRKVIDTQTVAVLVEPIQGEAGVIVPDDEYLSGLRTLCDEHDALLICDEVWTGCGRTGRYFAHQHWSVQPDIMTLAKGVGGGLAVGVMCAQPAVAELYDCAKAGGVKHASTLGGNCLAMAVTAAIFDVLERDRLVENAAQLGNHAIGYLRQLAKRCASIKTVRGKGLFIAVELDPQAPGAWFNQASDVVSKCLQRGVLLNAAHETALRLAPAMTISRPLLDEALMVLEDVLRG